LGGQASEGGRVLWEYRVVEQRYDAVMEVLRDGRTVTEVAERWGVSRQSLYSWLGRYQAGGLEGLADRSHRPRSCPHQIPVAVEVRICELRRRHPDWGPRRLHHELGRDGLEPVPSRSAIYRTLVRQQLIEPAARRRRRADYRRWERDRPMELWQLDVMGGVWLVDGQELKVVTGIDDHSRFCVMAGLVERANARSVCGIYSAALERYGIPEEVLTDNGKVFTGRLGPHPAEVLFDRICRQQGITHRCTGVRCPTTTGKIERFHKTLRAELFTGRRFQSLAEAQQVLDDWVDSYNTARPHQALGMATPTQRFSANGPRPLAQLTPSLGAQRSTRPRSARATEVTRIVGSNGCIRVAYQRLSIGRHLTGEVVVVRVEPTLLQIFHQGQLVRAVARDNTLEVRHPRAKEVSHKRRRHRPRSAPTTHVS
jgi:transposase InsO family protein